MTLLQGGAAKVLERRQVFRQKHRRPQGRD